MHKSFKTFILIAIVLVTCALAIYPPKKNLRLGRDLAGGVNLVYSVNLNQGDNADEVIGRMIEVLKERVNPEGLYEISFVQQGRDRISISMPLPTKEIQQLRDKFQNAMSDLEDYVIDRGAFERALRLFGPERLAALDELIDNETSGPRADLIAPLRAAIEHADAARAEYDAAAANNLTDPAELSRLEEEAAVAQIDLDEARQTVADKLVSAEEVRRALDRSAETITVPNKATGQPESIESPRETALKAIKARADWAAAEVEKVVTEYNNYNANRRGLDDPSDLIRILQGAGVLAFRIAVESGELTPAQEEEYRKAIRERGPRAANLQGLVWAPINRIESWFNDITDQQFLVVNPVGFFARQGFVGEEYNGIYYILLHDAPGLRLSAAEGDEWAVSGASSTTDQQGFPAIAFRMNPRGASLLGQLTSDNMGRPMAIQLDDEVYSRPPNINGRITSQGQIYGNFTPSEINYVVRTLGAGSLQAKLGTQPISVNNLAPELGADNLAKGLTAGIISFIIVGAFMIVYYFMHGGVAVIALLVNGIFILGVMALARAAFTLPGIAGVVLTFGMAVDANVLIYERIREELLRGEDLRTSVRLGFQKVLSTIVDGNITNLIVCLVLAYTGTPEIKGFAVTLGVGVVSTMFAALVVTRFIYTILIDHIKIKSMPQLPLVLPVIEKTLTPNIDWIKLRPLYVVVSTVLVGTGLFMIYQQREELLDTEFRGGTAITLNLTETQTRPDGSTHIVPAILPRDQVEARVRKIADDAKKRIDAGNPEENDNILVGLVSSLDVLVVNPEEGGINSSTFIIKTPITDQEPLEGAIATEFADNIAGFQPLTFIGSDAESVADAPVYEIIDASLGASIGRPDIRNNVGEFIGGIAIVLDQLDPPLPRVEIEERVSEAREKGATSSLMLDRDIRIVVLEGTDDRATSAAVLVRDPAISQFDQARWRAELRDPEWNIIRTGLTETASRLSIQSFSSEIASTFRGQAIVAVILSFLLILIYIWARFGSIRYSLAAIAPLVHDVIAAIGLIAMAEILYHKFPALGEYGIRPYKIDLGLVAAILTIIGYSLNDTIVILDRIRENRGRLNYASRRVVNESINQTISRTLITSGTTLFALLTLFVVGGEGIASFTYALLCGIIVGTYSSIAIAAPFVYVKKLDASDAPHETPDADSPST